MLNYHLILARHTEHPEAYFSHYLSTGSNFGFQLPPLLTFTILTLLPKARLPTQVHTHSIIIPLQGKLKADGVIYEPMSMVMNAKQIGVGDEESRENVICSYLVFDNEKMPASVVCISEDTQIVFERKFVYLARGELQIIDGPIHLKHDAKDKQESPAIYTRKKVACRVFSGSIIICVDFQ